LKAPSTEPPQAAQWRQERIGRPASAQALREAEQEARSRSAQGWRKRGSLTGRPSSASGFRRQTSYDGCADSERSGRSSAASDYSTGSHHKVIVEYDLSNREARVLTPGATPRLRAMYDYEATARDEVSFRRGDVIVNAMPIDDGSWMLGTVVKTGLSGMLPANYVRPIGG